MTLRRSMSTTDVDLAANRFQHRRDIISAIVLPEEMTTANNANENEPTVERQSSPHERCDTESGEYSSSATCQLQRSQSRSSSRLSGLKKLGSLYKTFKDDDEDFFSSRKQPTRSNTTTTRYINDSDSEATCLGNAIL